MRSTLIAAIAAATLLGVTAFAQDRPQPGTEQQGTEEGTWQMVNGEKKCVCKKPTAKKKAAQPSTGGAGTAGQEPLAQPEAVQPPPAPGELGQEPMPQEPIAQPAPLPAPEVTPLPAPEAPPPVFATAPPPPEAPKKRKSELSGVTVALGGGAEGYTGKLASQIRTGPAYGLQVGVRPWKILGLEAGYSGAVNDFRHVSGNGADMIRNGANILGIMGLAPYKIQPYVLGGVGFSNYNVRNGGGGAYRDDTAGQAPVGGGIRTQFHKVTADLRGSYNFLFDQRFATLTPGAGAQFSSTLNIGGTF